MVLSLRMHIGEQRDFLMRELPGVSMVWKQRWFNHALMTIKDKCATEPKEPPFQGARSASSADDESDCSVQPLGDI
jgi:hypothetical protein